LNIGNDLPKDLQVIWIKKKQNTIIMKEGGTKKKQRIQKKTGVQPVIVLLTFM
jgi:hypothetical protein